MQVVGGVTFVKLNAVAADHEQSVPVNQNALRTAPAEAGGNHFGTIEHAVAIFVAESPQGCAIADKQSALAIKTKRVTAAGQIAFGGAINPEAHGHFELIV